MTKVVFINRRYCPGEAWTNRILGYAKGLVEIGVHVTLIYILKGTERNGVNIPGVQVLSLWENEGYLARRNKVISMFRGLVKLKSFIEPGDSIFVYGDSFYLLQAALTLHKTNKIFCEVTEHPDVRGQSIKVKMLNKWSMFCLKKIDGLFVISNALKSYYINQGISRSKIYKINMFVDSGRFDINHNSTIDTNYIAYCGAVSYDKDGVDMLIKSFSLFHKSYNNYKLYVIGRGVNASVIPDLMLLAKEVGVENDVVFTGPVSPEYIPSLLVNAKILALARPQNLQASNGFPTKLGEYLATGNPVLVTSVGEIPEFINDRQNGFLSKPGDIYDFANKLLWIVDHYEEARIIGAKGKELAMTVFSYKTQSNLLYNYISQTK